MPSGKPEVAVIMGSASDWETMKHAVDVLDLLGIPCERRIVSAHRTPELLRQFGRTAANRFGAKITMARIFPPGSNIGVIGGGQLGRMFAIAARRMGYHVHVFTPDHHSPASQFADATTEADYHDFEAIRGFATSVDL